jgi:hypothetical protein
MRSRIGRRLFIPRGRVHTRGGFLQYIFIYLLNKHPQKIKEEMQLHPGYYYSFVLDLILFDTPQNRALSLMIANIQLRDEQQRLLANFHKSVPIFRAFSARSIISSLYTMVRTEKKNKCMEWIELNLTDSEYDFLAPLADWLFLHWLRFVRPIFHSFPKFLSGKSGPTNKACFGPAAKQIHTGFCDWNE